LAIFVNVGYLILGLVYLARVTMLAKKENQRGNKVAAAPDVSHASDFKVGIDIVKTEDKTLCQMMPLTEIPFVGHSHAVQAMDQKVSSSMGAVIHQASTVCEEEQIPWQEHIEQLQNQLRDHKARIVQQQATIVQQQATIVQQQATNVQQQATIVQQQATNEQQQATIVQQQATNEQQQATIVQLQAQLEDSSPQAGQHVHEIIRLQALDANDAGPFQARRLTSARKHNKQTDSARAQREITRARTDAVIFIVGSLCAKKMLNERLA
jgi:hypothetical protein